MTEQMIGLILALLLCAAAIVALVYLYMWGRKQIGCSKSEE